MNELKLQVAEIKSLPQIDANFEELKERLNQEMEVYRNYIVSEDGVTIAKKTRAELNKLKKEVDNERKRIKKLYIEPLDAFEAQVKELLALIDEPIASIDEQVSAYEETQKKEKKKKIYAFYKSIIGENEERVPIAKIFEQQWLNKSVSMKSIEEKIEIKVKSALANIDLIERMEEPCKDRVLAKYLETFSIERAMAKREQYEREQASLTAVRGVKEQEPDEEDRPVQVHVIDPEKMNPNPYKAILLKVYLKKEELAKLSAYMEEEKISFRVMGVEEDGINS